MNLARRIYVLPIRFYQRFISPWKPPTCRFQPSCSVYAARAVGVHGIVKGTLLGTWRILRCHPFSAEGPDPVPEPGRWKSERGHLHHASAAISKSAESADFTGPPTSHDASTGTTDAADR